MANRIPEGFTSTVTGPNPTETGVESFAGAARRQAGFFNQAAEATGNALRMVGRDVGTGIAAAGSAAVNYLEHREVSQGAANYAKLFANTIDEWNKRLNEASANDPNDPTVGPKFREQLDQKLEDFTGSFSTEGGQKWAEAHAQQLRMHMFETTSAGMSTLAKKAIGVNLDQTFNDLSNGVRGDPASLNTALKTVDSTLEGIIKSSPNLSGADAAAARLEMTQKGKEAIVKSAALGYIEKTGTIPPWATDKEFSKYINGAELKQFESVAKYYKNMSDSASRSARVERDYNDKNDFNKEINKLEASTIPDKAGDPPKLPSDYWSKLKDLSMNHPGAALEPGRLKTMIDNGNVLTTKLGKPEPLSHVSHAAAIDLLTRMRATDSSRLTDNSEIYKAYGDNKLNNSDFGFLVKEFDNLRTPDGQALEKDRTNFVKSYARLIDGGMNTTGIHSVLGTQQMYDFEMDARRQEGVLRQKGLDPHLVYDPRSEYFWGKPDNIARYRVSMQQTQQYEKTLGEMDKQNDKPAPPSPGPKPVMGERRLFKQGWGEWNGTTFVPVKAP